MSFFGMQQPRLAVAMVLKADFGLLALFATCCSTWSAVSRASGARTICTPMGCDHFTKIRRANKMVARTACFRIIRCVVQLNASCCCSCWAP